MLVDRALKRRATLFSKKESFARSSSLLRRVEVAAETPSSKLNDASRIDSEGAIAIIEAAAILMMRRLDDSLLLLPLLLLRGCCRTTEHGSADHIYRFVCVYIYSSISPMDVIFGDLHDTTTTTFCGLSL
jgi:hypothetical protein